MTKELLNVSTPRLAANVQACEEFRSNVLAKLLEIDQDNLRVKLN